MNRILKDLQPAATGHALPASGDTPKHIAVACYKEEQTS